MDLMSRNIKIINVRVCDKDYFKFIFYLVVNWPDVVTSRTSTDIIII